MATETTDYCQPVATRRSSITVGGPVPGERRPSRQGPDSISGQLNGRRPSRQGSDHLSGRRPSRHSGSDPVPGPKPDPDGRRPPPTRRPPPPPPPPRFFSTTPRDPAGTASETESDERSRCATPPDRTDDAGPVLERVPTFLQPSLPWRKRILHVTFAWYTVTMSTSGIALLLAITPHRFPGLSTLGLTLFFFDLVIFTLITLVLLLRFALYKNTLRRALTRPGEALFVPTLFLSVSAILTNAAEYGRLFLVPRGGEAGLGRGLEVVFWGYLGVVFAAAVGEYHLLFVAKRERRLRVGAMTPAWILPVFPVMLGGTLAGAVAKSLAPPHAIAVICAGLAAQGLGMLISCFFYATYLSRLMVFGLPDKRPAMFIAVGPPSFTCSALISMANEVPRVLRDTLGGSALPVGPAAVDVPTLAAGVWIVAVAAAVFLWGLSFWFFCGAVVAVAAGMPYRKFDLSWWSFVFPNVGFVFSTIRIGTALGSRGLLWFGTVMTVALVLAWAFIAWRCVRAVYRREIVWPGHDEDS